MKHTPAPWFIEIDHATNKPEFIRAHIDGEMFDIASLLCDETNNADNNARLIAAAPELADALDELLRVTVDAALNAGFCLNDEQQAARDRALALFERLAGDEK